MSSPYPYGSQTGSHKFRKHVLSWHEDLIKILMSALCALKIIHGRPWPPSNLMSQRMLYLNAMESLLCTKCIHILCWFEISSISQKSNTSFNYNYSTVNSVRTMKQTNSEGKIVSRPIFFANAYLWYTMVFLGSLEQYGSQLFCFKCKVRKKATKIRGFWSEGFSQSQFLWFKR
jgi:hypothetical protein